MHRINTILLIVLSLVSCGNKEQINRLQSERDSVMVENRQLTSFINAVSESMDIIAIHEGTLFDLSDADGMPLPSQEQVKQKLEQFQNLLDQQRQRMTALEDSLKSNSDARTTKLQNIIQGMKKQIAEKDALITQLHEELNHKDVDIEELRSRVFHLKKNVSELTQQTIEQEEAIQIQSNMMNEGYIKLGTKKELTETGLLSKSSLFSRKKLDVSNIDVSLFTKIDMREFQELPIPGKNPKILTPIPESAYRIDKNDDKTYTLIVIDPTLFWSVSNFLVIQYK